MTLMAVLNHRSAKRLCAAIQPLKATWVAPMLFWEPLGAIAELPEGIERCLWGYCRFPLGGLR